MIVRANGGYLLGRRTVELGGAYIAQFNQVREFYTFCAEAELLRHEVVQIAMLDGTRRSTSPGTRAERRCGCGPLGSRFPAAPTAVGNALLTPLTDTEIAARFSGPQHFPRLTERSVRTVPALLPRSAPRANVATPSTTTRSIPASSASRWCCRRGRAATSRWPSAPR